VKTVIHINRHVLQANKKDGTNEPPITVKDYKQNRYGHRVAINGPSEVVYKPSEPLDCGAVAWIITEAKVDVFDVEDYPII
jgi:hypothetical protein